MVTAGTLAACGGDSGGASTLTWYINPDSGGQAEIASRCTDEAGGAYTIEISLLPRESAQQREQLIRRLAAEDSSIDIMSLDPPYIPEFAQAGFLAPVPEDVAERVTEDVVQSAIDGSTWNDELVAVPFWANTQLLWYKKSVAEAAGLDMEQPVTWDQLDRGGCGPGHRDRRPGHPGRGPDGVAQRAHRVRRRPHHRGDGRRPGGHRARPRHRGRQGAPPRS